MKIKKSVFLIMLCMIIALLPACKSTGNFSSGNSVLKIGVEGLNGVYNPFYAESEADVEVVSQMFRPIQIKGTNNNFINHSGSISYEFVGDNQVKYTVSIDDGMRYSDGTHITIDDVIYYYHFIADATYDGVYQNWYLNDIEGLKEYYYDDEDYESSVAKIENSIAEKYTSSTISADDYTDYLVKTKLEGKYHSADSKNSLGQTWKDYVASLGYAKEIRELGENSSDDAWLKLVARAEAENNPDSYNPEPWYRELLYENYLKSNYLDGIDVTRISGIKKINDYTCSILFNSKNINAISEINAFIIPQSCYSSEYIKGSAQTVKKIEWFSVGSGPYIIAEKSDDEVKMSFNEFYDAEEVGFRSLRFINIEEGGYGPTEGVVSGMFDIVTDYADSYSVSALKDADVHYTISNADYYVSVFFNTRTLELEARKALMSICSPNETLDSLIGSYYTRVVNPLSIRFAEYPADVNEPYYSESAYMYYVENNASPVKNVTAYYCGNEKDDEYAFLIECQKIFSSKGIKLELVISDEEGMKSAIESGKADMWVEKVYDGATVDKYDYFNGNGIENKTGMNNSRINELTVQIRSAVGFTDKTDLTAQLMKLVMQEAVEWPLYQPQKITVYNTEKISPDSFAENNESDGFTYYISKLKPNN